MWYDILHDRLLYFVFPDVLSLVGDPLSGDTCVVHRMKHICSYFLFTSCFIYSFILDIKSVLLSS
jgi:hypothetical protein